MSSKEILLFFSLVIFCYLLGILIRWQRKLANIDAVISEYRSSLNASRFQHYESMYALSHSMDAYYATFAHMPTIYVITPTYERLTQLADMTRLKNTLMSVPKCVWVVIEDGATRSEKVARFLRESGIKHVHLNVHEDIQQYKKIAGKTMSVHRGSAQRNLAIEWLRKRAAEMADDSVVYFGDDDNSYHMQLFDEMRYTQRVSIWPVGFVGASLYEKPVCMDGRVVDWFFIYNKARMFPTDMASFAINYGLLRNRTRALFPFISKGNYETVFLKELVKVSDLEPKADSCTRVLVWHTHTAPHIAANKTIGNSKIMAEI